MNHTHMMASWVIWVPSPQLSLIEFLLCVLNRIRMCTRSTPSPTVGPLGVPEPTGLVPIRNPGDECQTSAAPRSEPNKTKL